MRKRKMKNRMYLMLLVIFILPNARAQGWTNYTSANSNISNEVINCITVFKDTVYIGTDHTVYHFSDGTWKDLGYDQKIYSFYVHGEELLIATSMGVKAIHPSDTASAYTYPIAPVISDTVTFITSDNKNNLWFSTPIGISVYSGKEWVHLTKNISFSDASFSAYPIQALGTSESYTYAGSELGVARLNYSEIDGFTGASAMDTDWAGLASNNIQAMYITPEGYQWFGTDEALYFHSSDNTKADWSRFKPGLDPFSVTAIAADNDEGIVVGSNSGLAIFKDLSWEIYTEDDGLLSNEITGIAVETDHVYWIASKKGVSKFDSKVPNSMRQSLSEKIKVYPGFIPAGQELHIVSEGNRNGEIFVFDVLGRSTFYKKYGELNLSLPAQLLFPDTGYYLIKILSEEQIITYKVYHTK